MATSDQYRAFNIKDTNTRREFERKGPPEKKVVIPEVKSKKPEQKYSTNTTTNPNVPVAEKPYELQISHYVPLFDKIDPDTFEVKDNFIFTRYVYMTGRNYKTGDRVIYLGSWYMVYTDYTSVDFTTDLGAGNLSGPTGVPQRVTVNMEGILVFVTGHSGTISYYSKWITSYAYVTTDYVSFEGYIYKCRVNHTSAIFEDDYNSGYWLLIVNKALNHIPINRSFYRNSIDWDNIPLWGSGNNYVVNDIIENAGWFYKCLANHTADAIFDNDLIAGKWYVLSAIDYTDTAYDGWIAFKSPKIDDNHCGDDALNSTTLRVQGTDCNPNNNSKLLKAIRREEGFIGNKPTGLNTNEILPEYEFIYFKAPKTGMYEVKAQVDMEYIDSDYSYANKPYHNEIKGALVMNKIPTDASFNDGSELAKLDDNCPHYFNPLIFASGTVVNDANAVEHNYCYCILDMKTEHHTTMRKRVHVISPVITNPPPETDYLYEAGKQYYAGDIIFWFGCWYLVQYDFISTSLSLDYTTGTERWVLIGPETDQNLTDDTYKAGEVYHQGDIVTKGGYRYRAGYDFTSDTWIIDSGIFVYLLTKTIPPPDEPVIVTPGSDGFDNFEHNKLFHLYGKTLVHLKQGDVINWFYKVSFFEYDDVLDTETIENNQSFKAKTCPTDPMITYDTNGRYKYGAQNLNIGFLDNKVDIKWIGSDAIEVFKHKVLLQRRLHRFFVLPNEYGVSN